MLGGLWAPPCPRPTPSVCTPKRHAHPFTPTDPNAHTLTLQTHPYTPHDTPDCARPYSPLQTHPTFPLC